MNTKQHFHDHFFFYTIVLGIVMMSIFSFYRFIIKNDYLVYYEGKCDPYTKTCFQSCEGEEECSYYMKAQKRASDVYAQCGNDVTDCDAAYTCLLSDKECSITYCDETTDNDCARLTEPTPITIPNIKSGETNIIEETQ